MPRPRERRTRFIWLAVAIVVASVLYATPWAAPLRHSARPVLPLIIVIVGTLAGAVGLVTAIMLGFSRNAGWGAATAPASFGASSLCMAMSFLPGGREGASRTLLLVAAVVFVLAGAVVQQRDNERSDS